MPVATERAGRVLVVSMQRVEKRNAIDAQMAQQLGAALDELDDDPDLLVGVLTGTPQVFSAGSDLSAPANARTERGGEYGVIRRKRTKPLIAAVEGPALGGGFEIVLACDLVVASTTASFGLPEVERGLVPACGGLFRTARALPLNVAREMLLTGESLSAQRAYSLGLVNVITEPGDAVTEALRLAARIGAVGSVAVRASMDALNQTSTADDALGWSATGDAIDTIAASEDAAEGIRAFFEHRQPEWTGR